MAKLLARREFKAERRGSASRRADLRRGCARAPLRRRCSAREARRGRKAEAMPSFFAALVRVPARREIWATFLVTAQIVGVLISIVIAVAYFTLAERKVIGWMQLRAARTASSRAPDPAWPRSAVRRRHQAAAQGNRHPGGARTRFLFLLAPLIALVPAFATWAVIPFVAGAS